MTQLPAVQFEPKMSLALAGCNNLLAGYTSYKRILTDYNSSASSLARSQLGRGKPAAPRLGRCQRAGLLPGQPAQRQHAGAAASNYGFPETETTMELRHQPWSAFDGGDTSPAHSAKKKKNSKYATLKAH